MEDVTKVSCSSRAATVCELTPAVGRHLVWQAGEPGKFYEVGRSRSSLLLRCKSSSSAHCLGECRDHKWILLVEAMVSVSRVGSESTPNKARNMAQFQPLSSVHSIVSSHGLLLGQWLAWLFCSRHATSSHLQHGVTVPAQWSYHLLSGTASPSLFWTKGHHTPVILVVCYCVIWSFGVLTFQGKHHTSHLKCKESHSRKPMPWNTQPHSTSLLSHALEYPASFYIPPVPCLPGSWLHCPVLLSNVPF